MPFSDRSVPGTTTAQLSRFLWTRGLWLVIVELTVMRLAMNFSFATRYPVLLLVLWALGWSMIALAALVHLPRRALAVASIAVILLHNAFDGVQAAQFGALSGIWNVLHQPGVFFLGGIAVVAGYPLVPWVAVMAAGFCAGPLFLRQPQERRRALLRWGTGLVVAFVVLRALNIYGDPQPWSAQSSPLLTVDLVSADDEVPAVARVPADDAGAGAAVAGVLRSPCPHATATRSSSSAACRFSTTSRTSGCCTCWPRSWRGRGTAARRSRISSTHCRRWAEPAELFPAGFGYPLWVTYAVWIGLVLLLYPACRWFAAVKARRRDWWLSYL